MRTWDDYNLNTAKQIIDFLNHVYNHIYNDYYNWPRGVEWKAHQTIADAILRVEREK